MTHINPGTGTTINPVVIDDSKREKKQHPLRCELCEKLWKVECPYYAWIKTGEVGISCDSYMEFTAIVGCASHASAPSQTGRLCDDCNIIEIENKLTDTERQLIMVQQRVDAEIKELQKLSKAKWDAAERTKNITFSYEGIGVDEATALLQADTRRCMWKQDDEGNWHTDCNNTFVITNDDLPKENGFQYCPYCGSLLQAGDHHE